MARLFKRTHKCGELNIKNVGEKVILNGWVNKTRSFGSLLFLDLRDKTGITQIVFKDDDLELIESAMTLRNEFVIGIKGIVEERESKNNKIDTGEIEIIASDLEIYSVAETPPIYIKDDDNVDENLRLKYRYLDLRKQKMQNNLTIRHKIVKCARDFFDENGFTEVETPILIKPTPEGARDYLVPSRLQNGKFYALPQSPQMFKQLLMVGGTDRYMQIAKCFRDEDLRADRQPEFTQIDLEMSFADVDDIIEIQEKFLKKIMKDILDIEIQTPFPRLKYKEAMERFGSDKPDTRFSLELIDLKEEFMDSEFNVFKDNIKNNGEIKGILAKNAAGIFSRKKFDKITDEVKQYGAKGLIWAKNESVISSSINKFVGENEWEKIFDKLNADPGDVLFIISDNWEITHNSLGFLRKRIAGILDIIPNDIFNFLWVVDFPMFEKDDEGKLKAMHHPFTKPKDYDIEHNFDNPLKMNADAYDIVLNGVELGGGSVRIHDRKLQDKMFEILGIEKKEREEKFGFLLESFKYGAPPHAGLAYGLDRMVMLLLGEESIREVIAFPKNQNAQCPVSEAPSVADVTQLDELGLKIKELQ